VKFTYHSPDGDNGFPGAVDATIIYTSGKQKNKEGKEATVLAIEYEAVLVDDGSGVEETVVNLTNHSYVLIHSSLRYLPRCCWSV
jgi:aldose 1-epimerase